MTTSNKELRSSGEELVINSETSVEVLVKIITQLLAGCD